MTSPFEIEVKLAASPKMLDELRRHRQLLGEEASECLVTTYFDSSDDALRRAGASLRVRTIGDEREQTLKLSCPDGASVRRHEWTVPAVGRAPDITAFPSGAREALAPLIGGQPVEPVATTRIERTTRQLRFAGSIIEIAFDVGSIDAGSRTQAVWELELELLEGKLADVLSLGLALPLGRELHWSVNSKAERCYSLARDIPPMARQAAPVKLLPEMTVAQGFQAIAWNCLGQLLANYPVVIASGSAEAVHQARVAIRRLRAASSLFADAVEDDAGPVLRAQLKAVASGLGPARDLQVLYERVASAAQTHGEDASELLDHLATERDRAMASAMTLLAGEPFQRLLFEYARWLESGEGLRRGDDEGGEELLHSFARRVLSRRRRKLRRRMGRLSDLSDADRHRLRIDTKKMRYGASFFAALFADRRAGKHQAAFADALEDLQDSLGSLNDIAVAAVARDQLFADLDPIAAARLRARLDRILASEDTGRHKLFKAGDKALARIDSTPAWWKPARE